MPEHPDPQTAPAAGISTGADAATFILLGVASAIFLGFGGLIWMKNSDGWQFLLAIALLLAVPWAGLLSVRFRVDESGIVYRSLFRRLRVTPAEIAGMEFVAERSSDALQGVPRFYLALSDGRRERLNIKILPLKDVRRFCHALRENGVPVHVQDAFVAKHMASKVLGSDVKSQEAGSYGSRKLEND